MKNRKIKSVIAKGLTLLLLSFCVSLLTQQFFVSLSEMLGNLRTPLALASGGLIFIAILAMQEGVINSKSIAFQLLYAGGCFGFGVLGSANIAVLALQNAFVLQAIWDSIQESRRNHRAH